VMRAAQDFDAFYSDRQTRARADPHTGSILVLTVDGKGVVMRPEDLREATRRAAEARADTFTARLGRGRRLHAKRMASVAAIYTIEPFVRTPEEILPSAETRVEGLVRPRPEYKRVWASVAQTPEAVITAMFEEAAHRDPTGQKRWIAVVDGNQTQLEHLQRLSNERNIPLVIIVDFIGRRRWPSSPITNHNKMAGSASISWRFCEARPAWLQGASAGVPRAGR